MRTHGPSLTGIGTNRREPKPGHPCGDNPQAVLELPWILLYSSKPP